MTTIPLGLAVTSNGVVEATNGLDKMTAASGHAEAAARKLTTVSGGTSAALKQLQMATAGVEKEVGVLAAKSAPAAAAVDRLAASTARAAAQTRAMGGSFSGIASHFQDIAITASAGMNPALIALQQGSQIAGQMELAMANGGKATAVFGAALRSLVSPMSLAVIGLTAIASAAIQMGMQLAASMGTASQNIDSATRALANQASPVDSLKGKISELQAITDAYAKAIRGTAKDQSIATDAIIANSEREFVAKKSLLELELKRQQAAIAVQRAELGNLREEARKIATTWSPQAGDNSVARGNDPRGNMDADWTRWRTFNVVAGPTLDKIKEMQANLELSTIGADGLREALNTTFSGGVAESAARIAATVGGVGTAAKLATDSAMALGKELEEAAKRAQEEWSFYRGTFNSFFGDLKGGLQDSLTFWEAFGNAGENAINRITDRLLDLATNSLFDSFFGSFSNVMGGAPIPSGGFVPGISGPRLFADGGVIASAGLSAYSGTVVSTPTVFPFAKGIGSMGEAGPEAILPLRRGSDGKLGVVSAAYGNGGGSAETIRIVLQDDSGRMAEIAEQTVKTASGTIIQVSVAQQKREFAQDAVKGAYRQFGIGPGFKRN